MQTDYFFILGGEDNEMVEIKRVLTKHHIPFIQPQTNWGKILVSSTDLPPSPITKNVYVECQPASITSPGIIIDHHNTLSHQPASLLQVLNLLKLKPSLRQQLIASIDSDFLYHTIQKFPHHKHQILNIWQTGYRNNFISDQEFIDFQHHCQELVKSAEKPYPHLLIIYEAPQSTTMIAAICNLKRLASIIIVGAKHSDKPKPCFFQGPKSVIKLLSQTPWPKAYWGKRYFGCRAIPAHFVAFINQIYYQKTNY